MSNHSKGWLWAHNREPRTMAAFNHAPERSHDYIFFSLCGKSFVTLAVSGPWTTQTSIPYGIPLSKRDRRE